MVEISSDVIRGYNDTMILCILMKGPSYGYEISKQIKTISEEKYVIKESTLYSAFTRMEKMNSSSHLWQTRVPTVTVKREPITGSPKRVKSTTGKNVKNGP